MKPAISNRKFIKIASKNRLHILIILIFNFFLANLNAQNLPENKIVNTPARNSDTIKIEREQLTDIVKTKAESNRTDLQKKMTFLNRKAQIIYGDVQIDADYISINWETGTIYARGQMDDRDRIVTPATLTQAGKKYEFNEVNYNYRNGQAITYNARTEESEGVIVAQKTKKYNDSVYHMRRGIYTTDTYFLQKKDTAADYHLLAQDIKLIKGKNSSQVITGPVQMVIEQVPTPLVMPFAILPFADKRTAGILIPSFGERADVGFYLNSLGYYQPIGEHFDLKVMFDFYTKGSWNIRPEMNYIKKYRYTGNFAAEVGSTVTGIKGLDDYNKVNTYNFTWTHRQDAKANPLFNFSASVNIVSNKFYNNTINNNHVFNQNVLRTQQNSSVSVTKRFLTLPITITGLANYSQNFSTGTARLTLPQLNVAVNQFFLFKPKDGIREGLLENMTVNTSLNFSNAVNLEEGEMLKKEMWDKLQTGLTNNVELRTNTTIAKYFTYSMGVTVNNAATTKTLTRQYNPLNNKIEDVFEKRISGYSYFGTSASLQTILYGTKLFPKGSLVEGIRHMMTPSIGFFYRPDFGTPTWGYYRNYYDATGVATPYSIFDNGAVGSPPMGVQGAMSFSLGNSLEIKVRSKSDSTGTKKLKIFESLNVGASYNFAAQTHPWSTVDINGQTSLFENKLNINSRMVLDPYEIIFAPNAEVGTRSENFGKFSLQSFDVQLSYPLSEAIFGKQEDLGNKYRQKGDIRNEVYYFDDDNYARFRQPWTLNLNAQYGYTRALTRFGTKMASVGLDGSWKLTPYWNINGSTYYDVVKNELAFVRLGFSRDQRSFTINFNWVPYGPLKVYDFFIGIKANILSDALKYKENSFIRSTDPF